MYLRLLKGSLALTFLLVAGQVQAGDAYNRYMASLQPWHGHHYYTAWGTPIALVVPPTVQNQYNWGWGIGTTRLSPVYHQFARPWPGPAPYAGADGFLPTPRWPSDTTQFGVYYVRGPW